MMPQGRTTEHPLALTRPYEPRPQARCICSWPKSSSQRRSSGDSSSTGALVALEPVVPLPLVPPLLPVPTRVWPYVSGSKLVLIQESSWSERTNSELWGGCKGAGRQGYGNQCFQSWTQLGLFCTLRGHANRAWISQHAERCPRCRPVPKHLQSALVGVMLDPCSVPSSTVDSPEASLLLPVPVVVLASLPPLLMMSVVGALLASIFSPLLSATARRAALRRLYTNRAAPASSARPAMCRRGNAVCVCEPQRRLLHWPLQVPSPGGRVTPSEGAALGAMYVAILQPSWARLLLPLTCHASYHAANNGPHIG